MTKPKASVHLKSCGSRTLVNLPVFKSVTYSIGSISGLVRKTVQCIMTVIRLEEEEMAECPKCRAQMTQGFTFLSDTGGTVRWVDGEPSFWKTLKSSFRSNSSSELYSRRCTDCGFVELFVNTQSAPVKTLKSLDEENERLRSLVARLNERVATLEAIATDPGERTAREIEALRSLPSAKTNA